MATKRVKIYTKTGDKGTTALFGGKRVPKYHPRLEAYGAVDELGGWIGLLRSKKIKKHHRQVLLEVQNNLMGIAAIFASGSDEVLSKIPKLNESNVAMLEKEIDEMELSLPQLSSLILPGGNTVVSFCHIARTVCRRAERRAWELSAESKVDETALVFLNRLSDYLFVLARKLAQDAKVAETTWNNKS